MKQFRFDREIARNAIPDFLEIYADRPIVNNVGGMGLNHSFATWFILQAVRPAFVVESGVWMGHSTWLIEQACPNSTIISIDPKPHKREYVSTRATYHTSDFADIDWSGIEVDDTVALFDDHQNAYARLKDLHWVGIRRAIFEDNFPCGEGDCYSLKHVEAGFGHPSLQMSKDYRGGIGQRMKRRVLETVLSRVGPRQQMLVKPNVVDRANLQRRLESYLEFPPMLLDALNMWRKPWDGPYETVEPLLDEENDADMLNLIRSLRYDMGYGYLAYITLR